MKKKIEQICDEIIAIAQLRAPNSEEPYASRARQIKELMSPPEPGATLGWVLPSKVRPDFSAEQEELLSQKDVGPAGELRGRTLDELYRYADALGFQRDGGESGTDHRWLSTRGVDDPAWCVVHAIRLLERAADALGEKK